MLRELWLDDKHHSIPIFLTWQGLARGKFCRSGEGSSGAPGGPAKGRCQQEAHTGSEWGSCRLAVSEARQTEPDQVQRACTSCRAKPEQAVGTLGPCPRPGLRSQPPRILASQALPIPASQEPLPCSVCNQKDFIIKGAPH